MLKKLAPWYIAVSIVFVLIVSLLNAWNDSAIFDETAHIPAGYSYLTQHDIRLNPEHPPLLKTLAAFPLLFLHLKFDTTQPFWTTDVNGQWDAGHSFLYENGNDWNAILFWSRVPIILISIALGLFLFWWGKQWLGLAGGLIAFTLAMFDPNILGHDHYVTTDVGIAAFLTFSMYFFLRFLKKPTWKNILIGGIFLGLAHLTKFSSVLLLPIFFVALVVYPLFSKRSSKDSSFQWRSLFSYLGKGLVAFAISILLVWVTYAGLYFSTSQEVVQKTIDFYFVPTDPRPTVQATNSTLTFLNGNPITRPLGEYILGVAMVFKRVAGGNGAYFMGQVSNTAFPAYFPTVFMLKETLPLLLLTLFALVFSLGRSIRRYSSLHAPILHTSAKQFSKFVRKNPTSWALLGFIVLYAYISITGNLNIGFRHLFPILPFLYLLIARQMTDLLKNTKGAIHFTASIIFSLLLLFNITTTVYAYPYYMSYFNPVAGGSMNGYHYVTDSNADWGQDLKRLNTWINDYNACAHIKCDPNMGVGCPSKCYSIEKSFPTPLQPIDKIHVDYFGGGNILKIIGEDRAILWWDSRRPIEPGWYAISVNFLQGSIYDTTKKDEESYRWLRDQTPVAQVGTSILIYHIQ